MKTISLATLERAFVVLMLFLFTDSVALRNTILAVEVTEVDRAAAESGGTMSALRWAAVAAIYAAAHVLVGMTLMLRLRATLSLLGRCKLLVMILVLALASTLWSVEPELTFSRSYQLAFTAMFGVYMAMRFTPDQVLRLTAAALALAAVLSLTLVMLVPSVGVEQLDLHQGTWKGVYPQKNRLGMIMAVASAVALVMALSPGPSRWRYWLMLAMAVLLVVKSGSSTGLVLLAMMMAAYPAYRVLRWRPSLLLTVFPSLGLLAALLLGYALAQPDQVLALVGRDVTFTGRTMLWSGIWTAIQQRMLLGYGFGAFWTGLDETSGPIWAMLDWGAPSAHNGLLETWLALGIVGVILVLSTFALTLARAIQLVRLHGKAHGRWPLLFLLIFVLVNITTSSLLKQNNLFWLLYVNLYASLPPLLHQLGQARKAETPLLGTGRFSRGGFIRPEPA